MKKITFYAVTILLSLLLMAGTLNAADWYVDANTGNIAQTGKAWNTSFKRMAQAFAKVGSGDTIYFRGKIREQLSTPARVFDVTVIGMGNRPRHADSTPNGGQLAANTWTTKLVEAASTPLVTVLQQGWKFQNILFAGPSASSSILFYRDAGAGDLERDASHGEVSGCRFASGKNGIEYSGGPYNLSIVGNYFHDLTDYAIKYTAGAGVGNLFAYKVIGNHFRDCAKWILYAGKEWEIKDNVVMKITTPGIDTSGGAGGNAIVRNVFDIANASFDPDGGFTGHATDVWSNYLTDTIETGLPTN